MRMEWLRASDNFPACWACFLIYETELRSSPSPDRSSASISRCHLMKHARCGLICANVDGTTRRSKKLPNIRCRTANCVQLFTAVKFDLGRSRDRSSIATADTLRTRLFLETAGVRQVVDLMARPKRFELLTPRFVVF
jgi:hypothetical protein